ncbi:hypothetical protein ACHQM5_012249 [Ranunculus cassubicifolius]
MVGYRATAQSTFICTRLYIYGDDQLLIMDMHIFIEDRTQWIFGIPFTKPNAEFVQSVKNQFSPDRKLLVVCQEGLRSAAAAYKLEEAGFENISCISSGLQSVKPASLVVVQGKISTVLGTVLVILLLLITVFPDQAEKILNMFSGS